MILINYSGRIRRLQEICEKGGKKKLILLITAVKEYMKEYASEKKLKNKEF